MPFAGDIFRKGIWAIAAAVMLATGGTAFGAMVMPLDLSQMTSQAGKIFVAHCHGVETDLDENGIPSTFARFTVLQGLKGVTMGDEVLVKQFGASRRPLSVPEGKSAIVAMKTISIAPTSYESGRDYLLLLYPESSLGFTSPVGAGQGMFEVKESGTAGLRTAVNPLGNRFLKALGNGSSDLATMVERIRQLVSP